MKQPLCHFRKRYVHNSVLLFLTVFFLSNPLVPATAQQTTHLTGNTETVAAVQRSLQELGYAAGPVDGILGEKTRAAIRAFQQDHNLPVDGKISGELLESLKQAQPKPDLPKDPPAAQTDLTPPTPEMTEETAAPPAPSSKTAATPENQKMSTRTKIIIGAAGGLVALGGLSSLGGGGGGGGGDGSGGDSEWAYIGVCISNDDLSLTTMKADLLLDKQVLFTSSVDKSWGLCINKSTNIQQGQHTVAIRILSQTTSPTIYIAYGYLTVYSENEKVDVYFERTKRSLETGESISWTFNLQW